MNLRVRIDAPASDSRPFSARPVLNGVGLRLVIFFALGISTAWVTLVGYGVGIAIDWILSD